MEDLNKNQIILLTLLVSFVTSIATGIVTVTLMAEAPPGITQTINRVVERTIERVVPGEASVATVIREVPVITNDQELVVGVVAAASPAVVSIADSTGAAVGTGFLATDKHWIVTADLVPREGADKNAFTITLSTGAQFSATLISLPTPIGVNVLRLERALGDGSAEALPFLELTEEPILTGQSVVALSLPAGSAGGAITMSGGLVTSVSTSASEPPVSSLTTDAANENNLGGPLLNLQGRVIGINKQVGLALGIEELKQVLASLL